MTTRKIISVILCLFGAAVLLFNNDLQDIGGVYLLIWPFTCLVPLFIALGDRIMRGKNDFFFKRMLQYALTAMLVVCVATLPAAYGITERNNGFVFFVVGATLIVFGILWYLYSKKIEIIDFIDDLLEELREGNQSHRNRLIEVNGKSYHAWQLANEIEERSETGIKYLKSQGSYEIL